MEVGLTNLEAHAVPHSHVFLQEEPGAVYGALLLVPVPERPLAVLVGKGAMSLGKVSSVDINIALL